MDNSVVDVVRTTELYFRCCLDGLDPINYIGCVRFAMLLNVDLY